MTKLNDTVFLVGGAVRDILLGVTSADRDFVVIGSTPEKMLAQGFTQVGANFPVFLHPETGDEWALARTERKIGPGYTGFETAFDPTVTLEEDLRRRDLTINAMALPVRKIAGSLITDKTELIDPFGGQQDLQARVLRHTSKAFAEDPLRVLRLARFAARFDFKVDFDTMVLARELVEAGELEHLTPERVWKEVNRAVMESQPIRFFEVLIEAGVMETHFFKNVFAGLTLERIRLALLALKILKTPLEVRLAVLSSLDLNGKEAFKQDNLVHWLAQQRTSVIKQTEHDLRPNVLLNVLDGGRLLQKSPKVNMFFELIGVLESLGDIPHDTRFKLMNAHDAALSIDGAKVTEGLTGKNAGEAIRKARLEAIYANIVCCP